MTIAVELKSIRVDHRASQETYAYSAKLFVDGVHVCDVANEGSGGCDRIVAPGKGLAHRQAQDLYDEADRRVRAEMPRVDLTSVGCPGETMEESLESLCAGLVTRSILEKKAARDIRTKVMMFEDGLPAEGAKAPLYQYRIDGDVKALCDRIRRKHPSAYILNEHPMADIVTAYGRAE